MNNSNFETSNKPLSTVDRITFFLWWCTAADLEKLARSPEDHAKFTAVGMVMLLIPCVAALSFAFFMMQVFGLTPLAAVPFTMLWGFTIFSIDRMLLAFHRKGKGEFLRALPRLFLGICLAHIIGTTLILQIFRGEIDLEMNRRNQTITAEARQNAEKRFGEEKQLMTNQNNEFQNRLDELKRIRDEKQSAVIGEIEGTVGSGKRGFGLAARQKEQAFNEAKIEYETAKTEIDGKIANNKKRLDQIQADIDGEVGLISGSHQNARGMLERHEALMAIVRRDIGAALFYIPLFFGLLMLEILPLLVKLTSAGSVYDEEVKNGEASRIAASAEAVEEAQIKRERLAAARFSFAEEILNAVLNDRPFACPDKERLRQMLKKSLIAEQEAEIRRRIFASAPAKSFDRDIEVEVVNRPELGFYLQPPREQQNNLTLKEMSGDLAYLLKKAQSGSSESLEISSITNSSGIELHRALPLLPQLEKDGRLLLALAPAQIQ